MKKLPLALLLASAAYGQDLAGTISGAVSQGEKRQHTFTKIDANYAKNTVKRNWFLRALGMKTKQQAAPADFRQQQGWTSYRSTEDHLHELLLYRDEISTETREVAMKDLLENISPRLPITILNPVKDQEHALVSIREMYGVPLKSLEQLAATPLNLKNGIMYAVIDRAEQDGYERRMTTGSGWLLKVQETVVDGERRVRLEYNKQAVPVRKFTKQDFEGTEVKGLWLTSGAPQDEEYIKEYQRHKDDAGITKYYVPLFNEDFLPGKSVELNPEQALQRERVERPLTEQQYALRNGAWELIEERYGRASQGQFRYRSENGTMKLKEFAYVGIIVD